MNIFVLHPNTRKAARWHVDKHVVKMLLETCQLLYTVHWVLHYIQLLEQKSAIGLSRAHKSLPPPPLVQDSAPLCESSGEPGYHPCHIHHPCGVWARESIQNYVWLSSLGLELAKEFRFRYEKEHSCEKHIIWLSQHCPSNIPDTTQTPFKMAMADEYKINKNPVSCYRHFYNTSKAEKGIIQYTKRNKPHWLYASTN